MVDISLFADVADVLGVSDSSIIEKDYWVTQLLSEINKIEPTGYQLVFSGGTCLSKAHTNIFRMSEDIDIKMVASDEVLKVSKNKQRDSRKKLFELLKSVINKTKVFSIISDETKIHNEYKNQYLLIQYPQEFKEILALRPYIQLEITESELLEPYENLPLRSLYNEVLNLENEVDGMKCVSIYNAVSEKLVALLRRTARLHRDELEKEDATLIRHAYDIFMVLPKINDIDKLKLMINKVIRVDTSQFSNKHHQFQDNPVGELKFGLETLKTDKKYLDRYDNFINPLVYSASPPTWDVVLNALVNLTKKVLTSE